MRIIAGRFRGHKLIAPKNLNIRPTTDRIKESIFNIIQNHIYDSVVIYLFSGTGNLGIEALSRGATKVYFIDKNKESISIIKKNLEKIDSTNMSNIIHDNVISGIKKLSKDNVQANIIFMDPPYKKGLVENVLEHIDKSNILSSNGIIIVEEDSSEDLPENIGNLFIFRQKKYGNTSISFYKEREE